MTQNYLIDVLNVFKQFHLVHGTQVGNLELVVVFLVVVMLLYLNKKIGESEYTPMIEWNNWVITYRNKHSDYHKDYLCKGCLRDRNNCKYYDEEMINCPNAEYPREEE